ncbi:hypothetical protein AB2B38_003490 [Balneola sp. MJW-20]|uniref:hypothetical protein n=1 Tax=Gracilimonas aurantiaca TaxID=3234185 RepID=UPI0034671492
MNKFQVLFYVSLLLIAASVLIRVNTEMDALANVILAIGGLLLISAMALKKKAEDK